MTKLYSLKEVSEILDISDTSLYKLLSLDKPENAKIKSFTIGRGRKIESDEVERFIEETRTIENMRKARLLAEVQMTKLMNDVQNEEEHKND